MFALLALLICYSLLNFGAVLPNSWLLLTLSWLAAIAGYLVIQTIRQRKLNISSLVLFCIAVVLFGFFSPKLAVGFIATAWAWAASRNNDDAGIVRFLHVLLVVGLLEAFLGLIQFFVSP